MPEGVVQAGFFTLNMSITYYYIRGVKLKYTGAKVKNWNKVAGQTRYLLKY